ncbi:hypothetical protein LCGC14_2115240 [marine sediment metagenome]|uniref:Uncharacterized protein n=1 Tax=marine sediment metagenome TaxID=412755 RepID=A0A0F9H279_9ZZZZ
MYFVVTNIRKETNMEVYLSHSIRGKLGSDSTPESLNKNCLTAIEVGDKIRQACPWANIYIPAEHESFVQKAYDKDYMTERQILDVDCDILAEHDILIIHVPEGDELQGGRLIEHDFAINEGIPIGLFKTAKEAIEFLTVGHEYGLHYKGKG